MKDITLIYSTETHDLSAFDQDGNEIQKLKCEDACKLIGISVPSVDNPTSSFGYNYDPTNEVECEQIPLTQSNSFEQCYDVARRLCENFAKAKYPNAIIEIQ